MFCIALATRAIADSIIATTCLDYEDDATKHFRTSNSRFCETKAREVFVKSCFSGDDGEVLARFDDKLVVHYIGYRSSHDQHRSDVLGWRWRAYGSNDRRHSDACKAVLLNTSSRNFRKTVVCGRRRVFGSVILTEPRSAYW